MNYTPISCFVCGGQTFEHLTPEYRRCLACGHEVRTAHQSQSYMLNEPSNVESVRRTSALDHFQSAVLDRFRGGKHSGMLVDIGSGSGRFLVRQREKFQEVRGVEVTPEAVEFSQGKLCLKIVRTLDDIEGRIDMATAWHSLEHFPVPALENLLDTLAAKMAAQGRVIVSVPNAASFQYRVFRRKYAFFDVENHVQQFTSESLCRLFHRHGFSVATTVVSWPYNVFGYMQALLNVVTPRHNHLYYRLKRRAADRSLVADAASFGLLPIAAAAGAGLSLVDALCPSQQGVLTYCFARRA